MPEHNTTRKSSQKSTQAFYERFDRRAPRTQRDTEKKTGWHLYDVKPPQTTTTPIKHEPREQSTWERFWQGGGTSEPARKPNSTRPNSTRRPKPAPTPPPASGTGVARGIMYVFVGLYVSIMLFLVAIYVLDSPAEQDGELTLKEHVIQSVEYTVQDVSLWLKKAFLSDEQYQEEREEVQALRKKRREERLDTYQQDVLELYLFEDVPD